MSNHNYSEYSNNKKKKNYNKPKLYAEETVEQDVVIEEVSSVEPVEVKMEAPQVETPKAEVETTITGTVVGCSKLNVRAKPATDADVLVILEVNSEVVIYPARSTNEWLRITTTAGVDGYCMRKFVSAKA